MCRSFRFYSRFLTGNDCTLDEYLSLFRKAICMDVVLAILIPVAGAIPLIMMAASGSKEMSSPISIILIVLLVLVTIVFVVDAILVAYYKSMVENAAEHMNQTAPDSDNLLKWLYICLGSATTGLVLYAARILMEILFAISIEHSFSTTWYTYVIAIFFFGLKAMRVASIRTFGQWIEENWAVQAKSNRENAV